MMEKVFKSKNTNHVYIYNYHRIGDIDNDNPFHLLHTIKKENFITQLKLMQSVGKIISIEDLLTEQKLSGFNFIIAFDDVSSSILDITPFLFENNIPFVISPCTSITTKGFGTRDKVYFILKHIDKDTIYEYVCDKTNGKVDLPKGSFSFYHFSKSTHLNSVLMEDEIILPLFESLPFSEKELKKHNAYLNWNEIRKNYLNNDLVTIANHGHSHRNFICETNKEIEKDINKSSKIFLEEINFKPKFFTVPFGQYNKKVSKILDTILDNMNYKGKIWVDVKNVSVHENNGLPDYFKIHTANSKLRFIYSLFSNFNSIADNSKQKA